MVKLRSRIAARPEFAGVKVSTLLIVAKALLLAAARHPMVNSSWDEAAQEIVVHGQVNLGSAAATPRGLVVPNVKDAGRLSLAELAGALTQLTETARDGRAAPEDMTGGTITIPNVGVFGVDTGTPRSEEHTSELQSRQYLVCRLLLEKKKTTSTSLFHTYVSVAPADWCCACARASTSA